MYLPDRDELSRLIGKSLSAFNGDVWQLGVVLDVGMPRWFDLQFGGAYSRVRIVKVDVAYSQCKFIPPCVGIHHREDFERLGLVLELDEFR